MSQPCQASASGTANRRNEMPLVLATSSTGAGKPKKVESITVVLPYAELCRAIKKLDNPEEAIKPVVATYLGSVRNEFTAVSVTMPRGSEFATAIFDLEKERTADVSMGMKWLSTSFKPATKKPITFADLPAEIRQKIWKYMLPEGRVVEYEKIEGCDTIRKCNGRPIWYPAVHSSHPPNVHVMSAINKESRNIFFQHYTVTILSLNMGMSSIGVGSPFIDPVVDTLFLSPTDRFGRFVEFLCGNNCWARFLEGPWEIHFNLFSQFLAVFGPKVLAKLRHIAIPSELTHSCFFATMYGFEDYGPAFPDILLTFLSFFTALEEVTVVVGTGMEDKGLPELSDLTPEERIDLEKAERFNRRFNGMAWNWANQDKMLQFNISYNYARYSTRPPPRVTTKFLCRVGKPRPSW